MAAGTILLSDRTPWLEDQSFGLQVLPLKENYGSKLLKNGQVLSNDKIFYEERQPYIIQIRLN